MNSFTLLRSSKEVLQKLLTDYAAFEQEPASAYKAIDCASSAWHLTDWVYAEYEQSGQGTKGLGIMREAFQQVCPELTVMHDVVTGAKHLAVSRPKSAMAGSHTMHADFYTDAYRDSYGTEMLVVEFAHGHYQPFHSLLGEVVTFWVQYFSTK